MRLSLIWAMSENRVIGRDNQLPWKLPDEMAYFRRTTRNHPIIMGRKTFEAMDCKPLPDRFNIVLTRSRDAFTDVVTAPSIKDALDQAITKSYSEEIFVIGGANVYREAMPRADRLYCSIIHAKIEGDIYMDEIDFGAWSMTSKRTHGIDAKHAHGYTTYVFDRP